MKGLCRHPVKRLGCDVGRWGWGWWQLWSSTSAEECERDSWHKQCIRCHFDKQISGAWGNMGRGADSFAVRGQLTHVQNVQTTKSALALWQHKSVITWKNEFWGDSSTLRNQLRCVRHFSASWRTFQIQRVIMCHLCRELRGKKIMTCHDPEIPRVPDVLRASADTRRTQGPKDGMMGMIFHTL